MSTVKIVLRKKKNSEGKFPLAVRITKYRKTSYIYLGKYIELKDWDEQNQKVKKSHPNSARLNNFLKKKLVEVDDKDIALEGQHKYVSARSLKKQIVDERNSKSFFSLATSHLNNLERSGKYSRFNAEKTRIKHFKEFLKGCDVNFQEITELMLKRFVSYLKQKGLSDQSVVNNLMVIRTVYNLGIRENLVDKKFYPFGKGKVVIKAPQSSKIGLNLEEVKRIEALDLDYGSTIWHSRNVWLFSFYMAGMRVSDVLKLKWSDFIDNRLYYKMGKNNKAGSLKIPDKAFSIIECYIHDKSFKDDFVFPELKKADPNNEKDVYRKIQTATKKFNYYLSTIASFAEIEKKITMHISRHTFGNISGDRIPLQMLQKLYRHSSITTTIGYQSNFIYKDADDALDSVIGT